MKNIVKLFGEFGVVVATLAGISHSTVQQSFPQEGRFLISNIGVGNQGLSKLEKTLGEHERFLADAIWKKQYALDVKRRFLVVDSLMGEFIDADVSFENNKERLGRISGLFERILLLKDKNQESSSSGSGNLTLKNEGLIKINECFEDSNRFIIAAQNALDDAKGIYSEIIKLREMCKELSKLSDDDAKKQLKIGSLYIKISEEKYKKAYNLYEEYARQSKEEFERGAKYYNEINNSPNKFPDNFVYTASL